MCILYIYIYIYIIYVLYILYIILYMLYMYYIYIIYYVYIYIYVLRGKGVWSSKTQYLPTSFDQWLGVMCDLG